MGQCGNQLGAALYGALGAEIEAGAAPGAGPGGEAFAADAAAAFFRPLRRGTRGADDGRVRARALLVDMEPKVVRRALKTSARGTGWRFDDNRACSAQGGAGNNWARGHRRGGPQHRDRVLALVRREVEDCDELDGFLLVQSLAGGTGAGLGTALAEALRDDYPGARLLNHCVWPYETGEVAVQSFNTLLSLGGLLEASDGVLLASNQELHRVCQKRLGLARPTFADLNAAAARALSSVLLPCKVGDGRGGGARRAARPLGDLLEHLCADRGGLKLLSLRSLPLVPPKTAAFGTYSWDSMLKWLRQMAVTGWHVDEGLDWGRQAPGQHGGWPIGRSAADYLVLRGRGASAVDPAAFRARGAYASAPAGGREPLLVASCERGFGGHTVAASLLSNCQTCVAPTQRMLQRARAMYTAGAYVHQYERFGLERGDFEAAFEAVEGTMAKYCAL